MSSKKPSNLELLISNYVRNNYEKKYNQRYVPLALKCLIIRFSNKIIGCKLLSIKEDVDFYELIKPELQNIKRFQLLFKASDHDNWAKPFHQLCDNKGPTLTIIKSDHGNIYGGYTSKSWTSNDYWVKDNKAFLFLIKCCDNDEYKEKCPVLFKVKKNTTRYAVGHNCDDGPIFGYGYDIYVGNNWETDRSSKWESRKYSYDYGEFQGSLCGSNTTFKVMDYQVFKIY